MKKDERISAYAVAGLRRIGMPMSLKKTTAQNIINATCEYFNLESGDLKKQCRKREIVYPRQCAIYLITQYTNLTLMDISKEFKKAVTDHTTIIHSKNVIRGRLSVHDGNVKDDLDNIYNIASYTETIKGKSLKPTDI